MPTSPTPSSLVCPHCGERLGVRAADIGKRGQCRQCGAVFRIGETRAAAPASPVAAPSPVAPPATAPTATVPAPKPRPTTVSFGCELCETRLTANLADVGKAMKCPDCGRRNVIPAPTVPPAPKVPAALSGKQFELWGVDEAPLPAELAARTPTLHPVVCELCQTLMYATDAQLGKKLKCPDCGTATLARPRAVVKPRGPVIVPDGDEYQLDESSTPPERPAYVMTEEYGAKWGPRAERQREPTERADDENTDDAQSPTAGVGQRRPPAAASGGEILPVERKPQVCVPSQGPPLPRVPVVQGVARMLLTSEVLGRWFAASLVLSAAAWLLSWVASAMSAQVFVALPMFAGGCMVTAIWALTALPVALAIVTESSEGNDRLHDPPNWLGFDFVEALVVLVAAAVSAIPAWLATKAAATATWEVQAAVAAAAWMFVFPIVLLSNLEQSSPLAVFSPRLLASLVRCPGPWMLFYIVSAALAATVGVVAWAIWQGPPQLLALAPWVAMAALLAYMRLIGRLAWWLAETMPPAAEKTAAT